MSSTATLAELMLLGSNSSFDPSKLATSTIQSIISHINTLKRNNIDINEQTLTINTEQMLNRLRDTRGKLLSNTYKRQIGMTIKRLFPNADISLSQYNQAHNQARAGKGTRSSSEEFMNSIRLVRDATLAIIGDVYAQGRIEDLGQYDACLATLLTLCTSLRVEEVRHLKMSHIEKIRNSQPIGIKSKMSYNTRVIANNNLLEATFTAIETQRKYVVLMINTRKSDYASQYHQLRLKNDYIILSTADYMRKKLHEIAAACGAKFESLGFTVFRKLTTSVLIEGGGFLTAQTMNNHSSLNTTLEHYNVMTSKSVQSTYDSLVENELNNIEPSNVEKIRQQYENPMPPPATIPKQSVKQPQNTTVSSTPSIQLSTNMTNNELPSTSKQSSNSQIPTEHYPPVQNIAEMLQFKSDLLDLKTHQRHVEDKIETELNRLPMHVERQIERVRNQVATKLENEFKLASQNIERDVKQIEMLRDTLNDKLLELQNLGVERTTLDELNIEFQSKIDNLEKSCLNTKQLREEFDRRLINIERLTAKIPKATDVEKFKRLESRLQSNMNTNLAMRTRPIRNEIVKINQDLENLKQLFGVEQQHQNQLNALQAQTQKTVIKQTEHDQLFQTITDELDSLRRLILDKHPEPSPVPLRRQLFSSFRSSAPPSTIEQEETPAPSTSTFKRRRIEMPFETPPYTPKVNFEQHMDSDVDL